MPRQDIPWAQETGHHRMAQEWMAHRGEWELSMKVRLKSVNA